MNNKLTPQNETTVRLGFFRSMRGTLLLLFLAVSLIPLITGGVLAYIQAQQALEAEATAKLVAVRDIKADQIETYFATIESQVRTLSEDRMIIQAMRDFKQSFHSLGEEVVLDETEIQQQTSALQNYYRHEYLARLNPNLDAPASIETYWPADHKTHLAQYLYIASNPNPTGSKENLDAAADGSHYSQFHQTYHPIIRDYLREFGYYDIFLVDPDTGHIVYTVFKEVDYTTSLLSGPYKNTNFARAFRAANQATDPDFVYLVDFESYHPSYNAPASFIASPIFDGNEKIGVLLFQMPIDRINAIMQERAGMGESGETYLVGEDKLWRSDSRFLANLEVETTILNKDFQVDTVAAQRALTGESEAQVIDDYRGVPVLSAYKPLNIKGVNWVILAEIDEAEAFAPAQQMLIVMLIIIGVGAVVVAGVAIFVANSIAKPVQLMAQTTTQLANEDMPRMVQAIQAVAQGDLTTTFELKPNPINLRSRNEIGLMAQASNSMGESLGVVSDNLIQMIANLRQLVSQVQAGAKQVAQAGQQLNTAAEQSSQAGQQVATTIQQVAQGTMQQTAAITDATSGIDQISHAAEGIARGSQDQAQSVQQTSDLIDEMATIVGLVGQVSDTVTKANIKVTQAAGDGATTITQTSQGMEAIRSRTAVTAEKIKEMGARSKEIDRIIETIDNIADKTDMLALNAAVEAARAGEAGRGFAVVADQVRKLSEDSKVATRDIANLIEGVQDTINEAVTAMHSTTVEVDNGVKLTQNTTQSLQDILQAAEEAAGQAERIDQAVTQLKQKSQGVVTAIEAVSVVVEENTAVAEEMAANSQEVTGAMEGVAGIAEENSASAEEVSALAEEMSAQAEEVVASAEELSTLAEELYTSVAQFRVDETTRIERDREQPRAQTTAGHQDAAHQDGGHQDGGHKPQPVTAPAPADPQHDGHGEDETPLAM